MKWEDIKKLYQSIKKDSRIQKDTKIQIKYNTKKTKNHTDLCKVDDFEKQMFKILEGNEITAMVVYLVNNKTVTPIFRYTASKPVIEVKPLTNNNSLVKNWNNYSQNTKNMLTEMAARIIMEYSESEEETNDGSNDTKDPKPR